MPRLPAFATDARFTFDGARVPARTGETVASALLAAGRPLAARSAKYHRPRGPFCLAGSCGNCLVQADGQPNRLACRTRCRDGLVVRSQNAFPGAAHDLLGAIDAVFPRGLDHHHLATWSPVANRAAVALSRRLAGLGRLPAPAARPPRPAPPEEGFDAIVVGAGPAGLGAAEALAAAGRRVLLAEMEAALGGRLRAALALRGDPPPGWADAVAAAVRAAGGEVALSTAVAGLWRDGGRPLALLQADGAPLRLARATSIVICTGAHPQPPAVPGGDRPGVLAARGAAILLAEHGVVPGRRVAVLGAGLEAEAIAARLAAAGADAAVLPGGPAALRRVGGRGRVRAAVLADGARVECDALLVSDALAPAVELARLLGAPVAFDDAAGAFALRVDASGGTGVPGLLAAGEVTGGADAGAAAQAGRRAGAEAARA